MTFTHHSIPLAHQALGSVVKCEDCGERHYNRKGCIEILKARVAELQITEQERDRYKEALEEILEKYQDTGKIYDLGAIAAKALEGEK